MVSYFLFCQQFDARLVKWASAGLVKDYLDTSLTVKPLLSVKSKILWDIIGRLWIDHTKSV